MREDPLGQDIMGIVLRCGGRPPRRRFSLKPTLCQAQTVVPVAVLGNFDAMRLDLERAGWSLAVGTIAGTSGWIEETADGDELRIPGQAIVDPLCPTCTVNLKKRLAEDL